MPKARKRKVPITQNTVSTKIGPATSATPSSSRGVIRRFHTLIKRQAQLEASSTNNKTVIIPRNDDTHQNDAELANVKREIEEMGGLEAYQRMSTIGQGNDRGGGSEKVFIGWLKELQMDDSRSEGKLRLLEVGALKPDNYKSCRVWIEITPMDLHSRHPDILEQDFLQLPIAENSQRWDAISLSLVLNFVPDLHDRGRMLRLAHSFLRPQGLLFVVLPLPCILNSRYLTPEHFTAILQLLGFSQLRQRWRDGGKVAYWLFRKSSQGGESDALGAVNKKIVLREGANRNNFCILL